MAQTWCIRSLIGLILRGSICFVKSPPELVVARIAAGAQGVVDLDELGQSGLSQDAVERRARRGTLHRLHQGIYAVGHPNVPLLGRFRAAVRAAGREAALSHRSVAAYLNVRDWTERDVEVTIPSRRFVERPGIEIHRSSLITREDLIVRDDIPMTNPAWMIVALAAVLTPPDLRRTLSRTLAERLVNVRGILQLLERLGPLRGTRSLRRILARTALPTRSELEDVVLDLILGGGFQAPDVNKPLLLEGRRVIPDFRWARERVIVEADGAKWHDHVLARADDAERQALLERHGETVVRVGWGEALARPHKARARIADAGAPRL